MSPRIATMIRTTALAILVVVLGGCAATYAEQIETAQRAYYRGATEQAAGVIDATDIDSEDAALWRLELASALQASGDYQAAARELVLADQSLEILDYVEEPVAELGEALFSAGATSYRASTFEKLLINTQNMLNFLAANDIESAAVEARRARMLLLDAEVPPRTFVGYELVWALAGFTFEQRQAYTDAEDSFREAGETSLSWPAEHGQGTVLVVVQDGRAPVLDQAVFRLLIGGRLRRLNLPVLVRRPGRHSMITVDVDGAPHYGVPAELDIETLAMARYRADMPKIIAAAALQVVPRAVLSDGLRHAYQDGDGGDAFVEVAAVLMEELLGEIFPADTRSWTLLPSRIHAQRVNLAPGRHVVRIEAGGPGARVFERSVDVQLGQVSVINVITSVGAGYGDRPFARGRDLTGSPEAVQALALIEDVLVLSHLFGG